MDRKVASRYGGLSPAAPPRRRKMSLERWKRLLPVRKIEFIEAGTVFRDYGSAWMLLETLSEALTGESFREADCVERRRMISREHMLAMLENCVELGSSVGGDDLDKARVEELIGRISLLDPGTMLDVDEI
jgi:hypothetical protein